MDWRVAIISQDILMIARMKIASTLPKPNLRLSQILLTEPETKPWHSQDAWYVASVEKPYDASGDENERDDRVAYLE